MATLLVRVFMACIAGRLAVETSGQAVAQDTPSGCDTWRPMSALGAPNGYPEGGGHYLAAWTGGAMLPWANPYPGNSGAYDPATDTWRPISTAGAPPGAWNQVGL